MNQNELIKQLSSNLVAVIPVTFGLKQYGSVLLAAAFSFGAGICISGFRADISLQILNLRFIFESFLLFVVGLLSSITALQLSIPQIEKPRAQKMVVAALFAWFILLSYYLVNNQRPLAGWGFACSVDVLAYSLLPAGLIFYFARTAAALEPTKVGTMALIAGSAFGALITQFICPESNPLHILVWHALPVIILAGLGTGLGKIIIKKL